MKNLPHHFQATVKLDAHLAGSFGAEGLSAVPLTAPVEFDGPGTGYSPEALLLASVASCVALTFQVIAKMMKVECSNLQIKASGVVDALPDKRMHFASIELTPSLKLANADDAAKLPKMWQNTEKHCLISNSLQAPVHIAETQLL